MKSDWLADLKEFLAVNKKLVIAVVVATVLLASLHNYIGGAKLECLGVADSKETMISFEVPVIVKRIFVLPGQAVKKGQPLLEVEPAEINLKILEVQTELEALRSELKVRHTLLGGFSKSGEMKDSPMARQVAGLQAQYDELKRQQSNSVRYAEEDGVVATVAYRPREQVQPFIPVMTLTSSTPNLVYGFIHEARLNEFRAGDSVIIEPVAAKSRRTTGKVISVGNRIAPFHERFQTAQGQRPTLFGREVVIALHPDNQILIGEKVSIRDDGQLSFSDLGFQAFAADSGEKGEVSAVILAEGLPLEAGGLLEIAGMNSLLVASDDAGPNGTPFWHVDLKAPTAPVNLKMSGLTEIDDVESLSQSEGRYFALSSLTPTKKGKIKNSRNLIARFKVEGETVVVDRALDFRTPFIEALGRQALLRSIAGEFESTEVEAFTMDGKDAFVALKEPRLPDGATVILKIRGLADQVEAGRLGGLDMEVYAMPRLESENCGEPARATDLNRWSGGLLILANCKKSEKAGQLWWLPDSGAQQAPALVSSLRYGRPEGMVLSVDGKTLYVSSDNGNARGSDFIKLDLPVLR